MVTTEGAPVWTLIPEVATAGVIVRLLVTRAPGAMLIEVTPLELDRKSKDLMKKLPSREVATAGPLTPSAEKMTAVGAPGTTLEIADPAALVDQLLCPPNGDVRLLHLPSESPPRQ